MEPASLTVPALMAAAGVIHWVGRRRESAPLAAARITTLFFILLVWVWTWQHTPDDAFPSPAWKRVSFLPAAAGLVVWIVLDLRRAIGSAARVSPCEQPWSSQEPRAVNTVPSARVAVASDAHASIALLQALEDPKKAIPLFDQDAPRRPTGDLNERR